MEKIDIIWRIVEILVAAVGASLLTRILTIRERVKQEKINTEKAGAEAKSNEIDNIKKIFEDLYQPFLNDLENRVQKMSDKVDAVESENDELKKRMAELEEENGRLKKENEELRDALREIRPDVVPSKRSINAQNQTRNDRGQFVKKDAE